MADSIYKWSLTAASNDAADSIINWRENQLPDTVNDSNRAMMKRIAELREDLTGGLVTTGTQPAYVVATNAAFDTLANGRFITVRVHATNTTGAATLNVNALGAKAIRKFGTSGDLPMGVGDLQLNGLYQFMYSTSANAGAGGWIVSNPSIGTGGGFASGTSMLFMNATAPVGWTISTTHNNKALRIVSATGGASGGTTAFTSVFASRTPAGTNTATVLTDAMLSSHTHTQTGSFASGNVSADHTHAISGTTSGVSANHTHSVANQNASGLQWGGGSFGPVALTAAGNTGANSVNHTHTFADTSGGISANHTHTTTISGQTGITGGDTGHTHPFVGTAMDFAVQYVDSIICNKD